MQISSNFKVYCSIIICSIATGIKCKQLNKTHVVVVIAIIIINRVYSLECVSQFD